MNSTLILMVIFGTALMGCTSEKKTTEQKAVSIAEQPLKGLWRVEDIDQGGVIDNSMVTIEFVENNRIAGSTGCNRYNASLATDDGFVVSKASSTRRACPPAISDQEQRFLAALNNAVSYQIEDATWLIIYDALSQPRLKLIEIESVLSAENPKIDQSTTKSMFQCAQLGSVTFRFLGPETIEVVVGKRMATLQRTPAASGTKYTSKDMMFWNQGSEALLSLDGVEYICKKDLP